MSTRLGAKGQVVEEVVRAALNDRVTFLAASIAFYAILSVFPLVLLVLVVGSFIGGEAFAAFILRGIGWVLAPEAQELVVVAIEDGSGRGGIGVVSLFFLAWSSIKVFRGLDIAFSMVYGRGAEPTFLSSIVNASIVLVAIAVGFAVMFVVRASVRVVSPGPLVVFLSPILVFVTITVVFFPMYFVFPGVSQPLRAVLPGTLFAALGWTILAELFGVYAAHAGTYALFGLLGALLLMLVWFYFASVLLLLGAVINAVLSGRYQDVDGDAEETPIDPPYDDSGTRDV